MCQHLAIFSSHCGKNAAKADTIVSWSHTNFATINELRPTKNSPRDKRDELSAQPDQAAYPVRPLDSISVRALSQRQVAFLWCQRGSATGDHVATAGAAGPWQINVFGSRGCDDGFDETRFLTHALLSALGPASFVVVACSFGSECGGVLTHLRYQCAACGACRPIFRQTLIADISRP